MGLTEVNVDEADIESEPESEDDEEEQSDSDSDMDVRDRRLLELDAEQEAMYERYLQNRTGSSGRVRIGKKSKDHKGFKDIELPTIDVDKYVPDVTKDLFDDDNDKKKDPNSLLVDLEDQEEGTSQRASRWFSQSLFADVDVEEDEDDVAVRHMKEKKRKRDEEDVDGDDNEDDAEDSGTSDDDNHTNGGDNDFEVVPAEEHEFESDSESDYDSDERAEALAIGTEMLNPKKRRQMIDDSYNRWAFNDDSVPKWFQEDEGRHRKPQVPVTKEIYKEMKERFLAVNARPIKKIAEAKARKKAKSIKRIQKAQEKASQIYDQSDLSEKSKMKAIQKLYAKGDKKVNTKPRVVSVVAKKNQQGRIGKTKDGKKVKMVDKRLKNDLLKQKKAEKRKQKGGGRRKK
eukprot:GFYU01010332.1.p1 GENE.GFYU01010332.1~~GFYU01010332.1.p1  ORF type:complete len:401 (-),score=175.03 GFYU01010332.1:119-1321(-)